MAKPPRPPEAEPTRGRPRLYDSDAEKLTAFRQRLQSAGYLRREVLVTERVAQELARLARDYGVSTGDAASALLEFGLERFVAEMPEAPKAAPPDNPFGGHVAQEAPAVPPVPAPRAAAASSADPITTFFKRRRGDAG